MIPRHNYFRKIAFFFIVSINGLSASLDDTKIPTYKINAKVEVLSLTDTLSYFIDESTSLSKDEIEGHEFTLSKKVPIIKGANNFWFRFNIINEDSTEVKAYFCDKKHEKRTYYINTEVREFGNQSIGSEGTDNGCVLIKLAPQEKHQFYITHWNFWDSKLSTELELRTQEFKSSYKLFRQSKYDITVKVTIAIFAFMALIALIFFIVFQEKFMGYYFLYIFCFFIFYSKNKLITDLVPYDKCIGINLTYLIFPFYLLFVKHLLNTLKTNIRLNILINLIVRLSAMFLLVTILVQANIGIKHSYLFYNIYRIAMFVSILVIVYYLFINDKRLIPHIICIGTLFVLIPIFSTFMAHTFNFHHMSNGYLFKKLGTPWGINYYMLHARVGVVIEIIFFSIAIAIYLKQKAKAIKHIEQQNSKLRLIGRDIQMEREQLDDTFSIKLSEFILHHKRDKIKLEDLMKKFSMGRTKLIEKIKKETGETPNKYIRKIKLSSAKRELLETKKSVKEIAYAYGYSAPSYFSKEFKAEFNVTPIELRKSISTIFMNNTE